jgi:hypothetical protein
MQVKTTSKGERVIMDPAVTVSRVYLYFYMMINVGSLVGSIGMVYAEKYVGFWLSFLLPTLMLCEYIYPFVSLRYTDEMKVFALRLRFFASPNIFFTHQKDLLWQRQPSSGCLL